MDLSLVATIAPPTLIFPRFLLPHDTINGTVAVQEKIRAYRSTFTTNQLRWLVLNVLPLWQGREQRWDDTWRSSFCAHDKVTQDPIKHG
jgi:hypothetical protein